MTNRWYSRNQMGEIYAFELDYELRGICGPLHVLDVTQANLEEGFAWEVDQDALSWADTQQWGLRLEPPYPGDQN